MTPLQIGIADLLQPISGRGITINEILPADVLARVELIKEDLNLIRLELGKPNVSEADIDVLETAPREVYFVAQALFVKANRFGFELNKTSLDALTPVNAATVKPFHVWQVVNAAYQRIEDIKKKLNIKQGGIERQQAIETTPNDVIQSLLDTNKLLSHLLFTKLSPADAYQQITASINLTAQLLAQFDGVKRIPDAPVYERRKTPGDVYARLYNSFSLVKSIASSSNLLMFNFQVTHLKKSKSPSDVYGLATLLKAELAYFHAKLQTTEQVAKAYYPGIKTPSDVFQRVGILEQQLNTLLIQVIDNPTWLEQ